MKCKVVVLVAVILISSTFALNWNNPFAPDITTSRDFSTIGEDPTFFTCSMLSNWMPSGGARIFLVMPGSPLGSMIDTSWSGLISPQFVPGEGIDSFYLEDIFTGTPMSSVPVNSEMGMALLRVWGEGYISVGVEDYYGSIKPSIPMLCQVKPSGETASSWAIFGPKNLSAEGDPWAVYYAALVDDHGNVVPDVMPGYLMDRIHLSIVGESNPDSSAAVMSVFDRIPARELDLPIIYGMFPFVVQDDQPETLRLVAEGIGDTYDPSDTFEIIILPEGKASTLFAMNMCGMREVVGRNRSIITMAMSVNEPDFTNSSSRIRLNAVDLHGTESVSIIPDTWQTLTGGVASFNFIDSESDTQFIFLVPEIDPSSEPSLATPIWTPLQIVPESWATRLHFEARSVALTGDTVKIEISAVNIHMEIDTNCSAYVSLPMYYEEDSTVIIIDSTSGDSWFADQSMQIAFQLDNGRKALYITTQEEQELSVDACDAENRGIFDMAMLAPSDNFDISFEEGDSGGASFYMIELGEELFWPTGEWVDIAVTARTGPGEIDLSYSGSASVVAGGSAVIEPSGGIIDFEDGIAFFSVINDSMEMIDIEVSGMLISDNREVMFIDPDGGGFLTALEIFDWIPLGTERILLAGMLGLDGSITYCNCTLEVAIEDPNDNGSVSAPDYVVMTNGLASLEISNSDAEEFMVTLATDDDMGEAEFYLESRALLSMYSMSEAPTDEPETLYFSTSDTAMITWDYEGEIELFVVEENDNGSVSISDAVEISAGEGFAEIENSEAESVWVYVIIPDEELLYMDSEPVDEWIYLGCSIVFNSDDIPEKDLPDNFQLSGIYPNPFNRAFGLDVYLPSDGELDVKIFDINGRLIRTKSEAIKSGYHDISLNINELHSGIYLVRVGFNNKYITRKAVLIK